MLVSTHGGGVDKMNFPIDIAFNVQNRLKFGKHLVPNTGLVPALKAAIDTGPFAIAFWHISPGCAGPQHPDHPIEHLPMILAWTSAFRFLLREQRLDALPLFIG